MGTDTYVQKFKLSALSYDYDKEPKGFFIWLESMGGFVRSTDGGADLEDVSKKLDAVLYNILRMNIKGSISSLLQYVRYPSYEKGAVLLKCMEIAGWVLEECPNCEVFNEQVKFDDMPTEWADLNAAFGEHLVLDSADYSGSRL